MLKAGKLTTEKLKELVLDKLDFKHPDVLVHAGIGEDSAIVDFGEQVLVISSDPITGSLHNAGFLSVHITCNDLAASGATPIGLQVVLLLPDSIEDSQLKDLMGEIHQTAASLQVEILGGHTEILDFINRPIIVITGIGRADKKSYIKTGGARTGDDLVLTKGVAIEGIYILAEEHEDYLKDKGVSSKIIDQAKSYKKFLSIMPEALIAAQAEANSLHDVTEGGLYGALVEMSEASGKGFCLEKEKVPVSKPARVICDALNMDPLGLISSGSLLITVENGTELVDELKEEGIKAAVIGNVLNQGKYIQEKAGVRKELKMDIKDELWKWMEKEPS